MTTKKILTLLISLLPLVASSQPPSKLWAGEYYGTTTIDGQVIKILIIDGDTIPVVNMEGIQITQKRNFKNKDERRRYRQWRKYAAKVYPYAAEAIRVFRQLEEETQNMKKRKKRKYGRKKEKELKPKYIEDLKKLTKSQGFILIKMVERELNKPFFDVVVQIEGRWAAMKWQMLGRWYGYNLKKGYNPKKDPLLESILQDLNISYGIQKK
ncbi:MAG: DUF4294 domain-containing protein [Saprospiraceae bacterium]|nr:DUF4294 domain-containing protein [Saprospiraceae bacterium]